MKSLVKPLLIIGMETTLFRVLRFSHELDTSQEPFLCEFEATYLASFT
jgi:hypothetical protein